MKISDLLKLENEQIFSLKRTLPRALEYHFRNFTKLEKSSNQLVDGIPMEEATVSFNALENIKFEVQAYVCQLGRVKYFLLSMTSRGLLPPTDPTVKGIWDTIINENGLINVLRNKWASHRSYDWPKSDTDKLHKGVLLNLESSNTNWSGDHLILSLGKHELNLCDFHPKVLKFIDWLFSEVDKFLMA